MMKKDRIRSYIDDLYARNYNQRPVSVEELICSDDYLGRVTFGGKTIFPVWKERLQGIFDEDTLFLVVLTGAIGTGKTTASVIGMLMVMHRVLCLKNPYQFFDHPADKRIAFAFFNLNKTLSAGLAYQQIQKYLQGSPWFMERGRLVGREGTQHWEHELFDFLLASPNVKGRGVLGHDVLCAIMDEVDSPEISETEQIKVVKSYDDIYTRFDSRFVDPVYKESIGKFFLAASKQEEASFLNTFVAQRKSSPNVAVVDVALWEVKGGALSGRKFSVALGDIYTNSEILYNPQQIREARESGRTVVEIPIEYLEEFKLNIIKALRDLAGISISSLRTSKLFSSETVIRDCYDYDKEEPVTKTTIECGVKTDVQLIRLVKFDKLRMPKHIKRFIHLDLAYADKGDCLGVAMSGVKEWKDKPIMMANGTYQNRKVPIVETDFVFRLKAPKGDQIHFAKVRDFILALVGKGYDVSVTADLAAMGMDMFQTLTLQDIECDYLSVDKKSEKKPYPYTALQNLVNDGGWICHFNDILNFELKNLELDKTTGKVDHPKEVLEICFTASGETKEMVRAGSKDMSDAVCGSVYKSLEDVGYMPMDGAVVKDVMENLGRTEGDREEIDSKAFLGADKVLKSEDVEQYVLTDRPERYWLWTRKAPDAEPTLEGPYSVKPMSLDAIMVADPMKFVPENRPVKSNDVDRLSTFKNIMDNLGR